jgi:glycosyltransferase involved in cell wall biosynthesis
MKVAVYAISLNEEKFVKSWAESAKDADYLLIADTGSTDNTKKLAKKYGVNVVDINIKPWRFDTARNASLALLPADIDYCIALDMDEVLLPGWRAELERAFKEKATRPRYKYTWNWKDSEQTIPGLQYGGDKIHSRVGYKWNYPVHEVMSTYGEIVESQYWIDLEIHHHADSSKPRSQYLHLLKQAIQENLEDDRNAFYYARELYFYGRYEESLVEFKRHLELKSATWGPERAASIRYIAKIEKENAVDWLTLAVNQAPGRREPLVELAQVYYQAAAWNDCLNLVQRALEVKEKPLDYLCEEFAWGEIPYDLGAIAAYNLGEHEIAFKLGEMAATLAPEDSRIAANLFYYRAAVSAADS